MSGSRKQEDQVWVRLGEEVLRELDIRCAQLRIKRPEAARRVVIQWLKIGDLGPIDTPIGKVEVDEYAYLVAVLDYVRNNKDRALMPTLDGLVDRLRSKTKGA